MKICPSCKNPCADESMFCTRCGAPLPEQQAEQRYDAESAAESAAQPAAEPVTPQWQPNQQPPVYGNPYPYQNPEEEVSTGKWVLYHLIPYIPIVGSFIYLVMLFVWGFGHDKNKTFRNWAKSQLIVMAISVGLVVLFFVLMFVLFGFGFSDFYTEFST